MPENLESTETTSNESLTNPPDTVEQAKEPESGDAVSKESERYVPLNEHIAERQKRHDVERQVKFLENQVLAMQQGLLADKAKADAPKLDPEIQKLLDPYLAPLQQENQTARQMAFQAQQELLAQKKLEYVRQNLPELDELQPEFARVMKDMDQEELDHFLASPKLIVKLGKALAIERKTASTKATKEVARAMGKTETGSTSVSSSVEQGGSVDWDKMSSEDFANHPLTKALQLGD